MNKFSIDPTNLKLEVLLDCILEKSKYAQGSKLKDYYTFEGNPKNWGEELIEDIRECVRVPHRDETFYVNFWEGNIICVFYKHKVYSFDSYYSDCPILASILHSSR